MKRNLFITAVFVLSLAFVSCGSDKKGSENVDTKEEASRIISYTNNVIDYLNGSGDWLRKNEGRISAILNFVEAKKRPSGFSSFLPDMSFDMKAGKKNVTNPPSVMSEEEQKFFTENMTAYKEKYVKFKENCTALHKYLKNEDYKDDDFAKGKELAEVINADHDFLISTKDALYDKIEVVTEKAENLILQDLPLREPILSLKADLNNFKELFNIYSAYSEGNATAQQVEAKYQEVAASIEKNKNAHTSLLEENNKKSHYESFYKRADDAIAVYRRVLRDVKANKKVTDSNFNTFNSNYNYLIDLYNRFVG